MSDCGTSAASTSFGTGTSSSIDSSMRTRSPSVTTSLTVPARRPRTRTWDDGYTEIARGKYAVRWYEPPPPPTSEQAGSRSSSVTASARRLMTASRRPRARLVGLEDLAHDARHVGSERADEHVEPRSVRARLRLL